MTSQSQQIKNLREKNKQLKEEFEQYKLKKNEEIEIIAFEAQKAVKAFQSLMAGITIPQAIQDYYELYEQRNKAASNIQKEKQTQTYFG